MMSKTLYKARKKTPTILQMEATECGAASLSIILGYYGKFISAEEARDACDISRDGSKAINIIKAARNYAMDAHGFNLDIDELIDIETPFIVYWEFAHFLVVEGFSKKKVFINDPNTGPRKITWSEFEKSYTGIVLCLKPTENFEKSGHPEKTVFSMLLNHIGKNNTAFFFIIIITLALIIPEIAIPIFSKIFIDNILIDQQAHLIPVLLIGLSVTILLTVGFTWIQQWYLLRLKIKLTLVNSVNFVWHMLQIPIRFFQQRASGDIVERNLINNEISHLLSNTFPITAVKIIQVIVIMFVMLLLSWQLAISIVAINLIVFIFLFLLQRNLVDIGRRNSQDRGRLNGVQINGIKIMETLKAAALEQHFFTRWAAHYTKSLNSQQKIIIYQTALQIIPELFSAVATIVLLCYGAYLVIQGQITIGTIIAMQALMIIFEQAMNGVFDFITHLQQAKGDMVRLNDLVDAKPEKILAQEAPIVNDLTKKRTKYILELKKINFGYSRLEPPIFNQLSIKLRQGERIALIGPSGSGKSSLTKLICAVYEPSSGEILINHLPFRRISRNALSKFIAYVDQAIYLFSGTLRENLTLYNASIADADIEHALKISCIYDDIVKRGGLNTKVTEGGSNFSGGQLQRLEIARALIQKPKLLVLDEATSAMDPLLEETIYKNLLAQNCSLVIIAHRLSAIRDCDRIYVLENGEITQQGPHSELIEQEGLYKQLVTMEQL